MAQKLADAIGGQWVEAQDPDSAISRYHPRMGPVVGPEPVRLAAGEAEPRTPEGVKPATQAVQRRAPVGRPRSHLVETVDEQGRASPFRAVLERQKIADGEAVATGAVGFVLELRRLAGA